MKSMKFIDSDEKQLQQKIDVLLKLHAAGFGLLDVKSQVGVW